MISAAAVPISPSLRVDSGAAAGEGVAAATAGGIGALGAAGRMLVAVGDGGAAARIPVAVAVGDGAAGALGIAGRVPVAVEDAGAAAGTGRNTGAALAGDAASGGAVALNTTPQCTQNFALA